MLDKVVSRVRRHFRRPQGHQQPPDLRRWSDFMNPFPEVSPGGYRRYYETHGFPEPKPIAPIASPVSLKQLSSPRRLQGAPHKPPASAPPLPFPSSSPTNRRNTKKSRALSTIPEGSQGMPVTSVRMPALSNTSSLRRRRRQLLRTPSVERDFPSRAPTVISTKDLDGFSSNESSESHSSQSDSLDTPATTVEGSLDEEDATSVIKEEAESDGDPYDRPGSRSSYRTARSDFSDD